jgi:anaerobic selenocysteine-containing dehydrogenase
MVDYRRRDFLKLGLTSIATLPFFSLSSHLLSAAEKGIAKVTPLGKIPEVIPSTCMVCPAGCGILGYLENGVLTKIQGNPKHPVNRGKICSKGIAGLNYLTDPDRILYPLRREGKRGEGKWKRITWSEAYETLAARLKAMREIGKSDDFVFESGLQEPLSSRFMSIFGSSSIFEHSGWGDGNSRTGHALTWGSPEGVSDVSHARYIVNFGSNPYESHDAYLGLVQRIIDARINNPAKLVTFDCRLSNTAGKSDEWFPINPGTDGMVALAMARVIMERGLDDTAFLRRWTNISREVLYHYIMPFTPEMVAKESGVKASDIRRIAEEFVTKKPSTVVCGQGLTGHQHGVFNQRCVLLLNAVAGNIDVEGGYCLPQTFHLPDLEPLPSTAIRNMSSLNVKHFHTGILNIKERSIKPSFYMAYMYNPVYTSPDGKSLTDVLKDESLVPYFVAMDTHITETGTFADIILPAATYLESWGIEVRPSLDRTPYISLRQPISQPLGELMALKLSKPIETMKPKGEAAALSDVWIELAKRIKGGMERYFEFKDTEGYIKKLASRIEGLDKAGGFEYLKKEGFFVHPKGKISYRSYEKKGFSTPSGKFEISIRDNLPPQRSLQPNELILTTFTWNVLTSRNASCKWVSEIVHDNPAWINFETAEGLGIKTGDRIKITSSIGSVVTRAFVTQGINPRVIAISGGCGHWGSGRIAQGKRFKSDDKDTNLLWWEKKGNGVHPYSIIPVSLDPQGFGQGWNDTRITVMRL